MKMREGFTLVELIVVTIIIGILITIAIPQYIRVKRRSEWSQAYLTLDELYKAEQMYYTEYGEYSDSSSGFTNDFAQEPFNSLAKYIDLVPDSKFQYAIENTTNINTAVVKAKRITAPSDQYIYKYLGNGIKGESNNWQP